MLGLLGFKSPRCCFHVFKFLWALRILWALWVHGALGSLGVLCALWALRVHRGPMGPMNPMGALHPIPTYRVCYCRDSSLATVFEFSDMIVSSRRSALGVVRPRVPLRRGDPGVGLRGPINQAT